MLIRYKRLVHEITEDAPFTGALISAIGCNINCKGCYNQHLKEIPTVERTAEDIIQEVLSNPFNEGIILGGLEWSEQYFEAIALCVEAQANGLKTIIYTGHDIKWCSRHAPMYLSNAVEYLKTGEYVKGSESVVSEGVTLASSNQNIS